MFIENKKLKTKREVDGKINLYFWCIGGGFKKSETTHEEELSYLLESLTNYLDKN